MPKADTITMRVDPELKRQAEKLCSEMGLTLSTAYTMLLKAIVRTRSIPFEIKAPAESPRSATLAALKEAEDIASGRRPAKTYPSAAALIREAEDEVYAEDQADHPVQAGPESRHQAAS